LQDKFFQFFPLEVNAGFSQISRAGTNVCFEDGTTGIRVKAEKMEMEIRISVKKSGLVRMRTSPDFFTLIPEI